MGKCILTHYCKCAIILVLMYINHTLGLKIYQHLIQRASEASEADSQSCSIEISDIYIYICRYVCVRQKISPALLIT